MKKLISYILVLGMLAATCLPSVAMAQRRGPPRHGPHGHRPPPPPHHVHRNVHHHHHRTSKFVYASCVMFTLFAVGSVLQACAEPPRREVVYTTRYVEAPTVVREVQYVQPQVQYVQPKVVIPESTITIWVRNSNDSQTPVTLRRASGGRYIGPRGEYYDGIPGNGQLRELYGM